MKQKQSRRSFCVSCLAAGGLAASGKGFAEPGVIGDKVKDLDHSQIGYCGYRCDICPGRSDDRELRRRMVAGWKKIFGHTSYTEENVPVARPCAGCKGKGEVADQVCQARSCAQSENLVSCADCSEFPCSKVRPLLADRGALLMAIRGKDVTEEEYRLSAMQFESLPVLLRRMGDNGKLPSWVKGLL